MLGQLFVFRAPYLYISTKYKNYKKITKFAVLRVLKNKFDGIKIK